MKIYKSYKYSPFLASIYFLFGLFLLAVGTDMLIFNKYIQITNEIGNPKIAGYISLLLGFVTSTGMIKNIFNPWTLIDLTEKGVRINLSNDSLMLQWNDIQEVSIKKIRGILTNNYKQKKVKAICLKTHPTQYKTPTFSRHRVSIIKEEKYDLITIDAALNKPKQTIVNDILKLQEQNR